MSSAEYEKNGWKILASANCVEVNEDSNCITASRVHLGGDTEDNLILVCAGCHAKLTPKSALTKLGLRNRIYNIKMSFYKWVGEFIDAGEKPDTDDFFDFIENLEEILAGNKEV